METHKRHTLSEDQLQALKANLHRIPDVHPVDRTSGPAPAKKSRIIVWSSAFISVAATLALVFTLWTPASAPTDEEIVDQLYALGYIETEDLLEFVEPDSLGIATLDLDADVYFDYFNSTDEYLLEL